MFATLRGARSSYQIIAHHFNSALIDIAAGRRRVTGGVFRSDVNTIAYDVLLVGILYNSTIRVR